MKLLIIFSTMILGLSLNAQAQGIYGDDSISEAGVAAPASDPTREDCKCLQPKKVELPLDNEANTTRVVNWISDPAAPGSAPAYTADPETTH